MENIIVSRKVLQNASADTAQHINSRTTYSTFLKDKTSQIQDYMKGAGIFIMVNMYIWCKESEEKLYLRQ